jgi:hypothetical protein
MLNIVYHFNFRNSPLLKTKQKFTKPPTLNAIK